MSSRSSSQPRSPRLASRIFAVAAGCVLLSSTGVLSAGAQESRITAPIVNGKRVALESNINPRARSEYDTGRLASSTPLSIAVMLAPSPKQRQELEELLANQQNPASESYHQWLSPEEYAQRFGVSDDDLAKLSSWLQSQGLTVGPIARGHNSIYASGLASQVENTFQTELHVYEVRGKAHFANATAPSVPAAFDGLILDIHGLNDFRLKPLNRRALTQQLPSVMNPRNTSGGTHYLAPGDVATIYDVKPFYTAGIDGANQTIAVAGQTDIYLSDIQTFRNNYGLPVNNPQMVLLPSSQGPGVSSGDLAEADLDLEWAGAMAPRATILYVYSGDVMQSVRYAVDQKLAPVVSVSYGLCEAEMGRSETLSLQAVAQQANAQGITWFAASGDFGAADCDDGQNPGVSVDVPASIPEVTGVGGTEFSEAGGQYWNSFNDSTGASARSYIPEVGWNDSVQNGDPSASGGGASVFFSKPTWQTGAGVPSDNSRHVPDIALNASADHDGYLVITGGQLEIYGGTSAPTPTFAGIAALINQYVVAHGVQGSAGLGNINPTLYSLAQTKSGIFHDVTGGNNIVSVLRGSSVGYNAGVGYDQVTGLGSVDAYQLALNWTAGGGNSCSYSINPTSINVGAPLTGGSVTVTSSSGCSWTASANASWIVIGSGASGTASGTVTYSIQANTASTARTGTVTIAGQTFSIAQAGAAVTCSFSVNPTAASVASGAASASVSVTATQGCSWAAASNASWLIITSGSSGSGSTSVGYSISANTTSAARVGTLTIAGTTVTVTQAASGTALGFFPLTPCRMVDTRTSQTKTGAYGPPSLIAGANRLFPLLTSGCGVPVSATAYSLNATVVPHGELDFLTIWPAGESYPGVSTLNSPDGSTLANAAIITAGSGGAVSTLPSQSTDLILDVNGYFAPPNGQELAFYPITPCRAVDTRTSQGKTGLFGPPALSANTARDFPIPSSGCGVPSNAAAYSLNMTAVPQGPLGFLSTWPTGESYPGVSTLNSPGGSVIANAAIVPAGTSGYIRVLASNPTDFIIDVNGYFAAPGQAGALHYYALSPPCRAVDTRPGHGTTGQFGPPGLAANASRSFPLLNGSCGVPSSAQAYALNVTAVPQGAMGFMSIWPTGQAYPNVSTLNAPKGLVVANAAIVPAGTGGAITVMPASATDLIIDIAGYFAP